MTQQWLAIAAVVLLLAGSMAALSLPFARSVLPAEAGRKALHVEMGLVTLAFPWMFAAAWPVVALAGVSITWFAALRLSPRLAGAFRAPLDGAGRGSMGEIWFACGVCATFVLAFG
jgi:phytol kinase